eukprot:m.15220 g.15220  ORF g.15220 m.15220 type:complete len:682 (-) comp5329_c0_seq1:182-2227(-)
MSSPKLFSKILVANRGEIACRVMKTARRLGIETVAVHSDVDVQAVHVRMADEAVNIGPAPSNQSYLCIDKILEAIEQTGAEAVHPGYGFLSENSEFSQAVADAGVAFIGPGPKAMDEMGDKIRSMRIAQEAGVSCAPRYDGEVNTVEHALEIAREVGYPIIMKASAGGGGKGMRIAWEESELAEGFQLAREEAMSSFGDSRMLIQNYVCPVFARHIEIQVMGDKHGNYIYLPERECSIQRRHQKVIEEAPSVYIDEDMRKAMGEQAVALARAVGYESAGTVEFLADENKKFYFLEMNTRLQVEHPVTELVSGIDLVEEMIRVAAGEKLSVKQSDININGWAVESRVYAEDSVNYMPSIGLLHKYIEPTSDDQTGLVRVDSGVAEGSEISIYYDPMISKLITYGKDRTHALELMEKALDSYVIKGVEHNIPLLRDVIQQERFRKGNITTKFLEEEYPEGFPGYQLADQQKKELVASAACVHAVQQMAHYDFPEFKDSAPSPDKLVVVLADEEFSVSLNKLEDGSFQVTVNGETLPVQSNWAPGKELFVGTVGGNEVIVQQIEKSGSRHSMRFHGTVFDVAVRRDDDQELYQFMKEPIDTTDMDAVLTPMPGVCVAITVQPGDTVSAGQVVAVVEAMKMQNNMLCPRNGVVKAVHVEVGTKMGAEDILIELEKEEAAESTDLA